MKGRRLTIFFSCAVLLLACSFRPALSANPPEYDSAKAQLEQLRSSGSRDAASWKGCAEAFRKVWSGNPRWGKRAAALYRSAAALEGLARVTKSPADARSAAAAYEKVPSVHPASALADDALYRAAAVCHELLNDDRRAAADLDAVAKRYAGSDHAGPAATLRASLASAGKRGASVPSGPRDDPGKGRGAAGAAPAKNGPASAGPSAGSVEGSPAAAPGKPGGGVRSGDEGRPGSQPSGPVPAGAAGKERAPGKAGTAPAVRGGAVDGARQRGMVERLGLSVRTIVLDAGHGGKDPGTMHNGVVERDVTLDVVLRLEKLLSVAGYRVRLSRRNNAWVSLADRVRFGREAKGDLFISIHVNACDDPAKSGMETYVLDFARSSAVTQLAVSENAGSSRLGDMDRVLSEILTGARTSESRRLASSLQRSTLAGLRAGGAPAVDGGVKGAPFFVLVGSSMPCVLVEIGYCTNDAEASRLLDAGYRQILAKGLADGIAAYAGPPPAQGSPAPPKSGTLPGAEKGGKGASGGPAAQAVGKSRSGTGAKAARGRQAKKNPRPAQRKKA